MESIAKLFEDLRHDPNHHLGLGDIRITIGQQEEILSFIEKLENDFIEKLENDRLDLLAIKEGHGPTALSMVLAARDRLKEEISQLEKANEKMANEITFHKLTIDMLNRAFGTPASFISQLREEILKYRTLGMILILMFLSSCGGQHFRHVAYRPAHGKTYSFHPDWGGSTTCATYHVLPTKQKTYNRMAYYKHKN